MDFAGEDGVVGGAFVDPLETFEEREGNVGELIFALEGGSVDVGDDTEGVHVDGCSVVVAVEADGFGGEYGLTEEGFWDSDCKSCGLV